jgi:cobalt-zinc-cadmium efflux system outer membrane protein
MIKNIRIFYFTFILLSQFFILPIRAQETGDILSIEKAIVIAWQNNPEVLEARKKIEIQEAYYRRTRKLDNPEIEFEVNKLRKDFTGENEYDKRALEGEGRVNQSLELWGKKGLRIGIAKDEVVQAELEYKKLWLDISRQIKEQYAQTFLGQKSIELAEENLNIARRLLDQVQVRSNTGKARNHELARAKLEAAKARNGLLKVENDFRIALGKLNILLGRKMNEIIKLQDNLTPQAIAKTLEEYLDIALSQNPELLSQKQEVVKRDKELKFAKRQKLPDVTVSAFANREDELYNAGAGISFEFPLWHQFQGDVKAAYLEKETARIHFEALNRMVELDVYEAFQNVNLTFQIVHNLEDSIKEANELLRIITIEYAEGEAPFLTYLEGIASYQKTKQEYLEALTDYSHKLADLEQSIGQTKEFTEEKKK